MFWKKKEEPKMDIDAIINEFYDMAKQQLRYDFGKMDFSFFMKYGEEICESESVLEIQDLVINMIIHKCFIEVVGSYDLEKMVGLLNDLATVPEFCKIAPSELTSGIALTRILELRKHNSFVENVDVGEQMDLMSEKIEEYLELSDMFCDDCCTPIEKQMKSNATDESKDVMESIQELSDFLLLNFSDDELVGMKKALISFAMNYDGLCFEQPIVDNKNHLLMSKYDAYYFSPYQIYFVSSGEIMFDYLMGEILIDCESEISEDRNVGEKINEYINQHYNDEDFKKNLLLIKQLLDLYQWEDFNETINAYL